MPSLSGSASSLLHHRVQPSASSAMAFAQAEKSIRFAGDNPPKESDSNNKPPEDTAAPKKGGLWGRLKKAIPASVAAKAKELQTKATEVVTQWTGGKAPEGQELTPASEPIADEVETLPNTLPKPEAPQSDTPQPEAVSPQMPPVTAAPAKKPDVLQWVKDSIPGANQALEYMDESLKRRFIKQVMQEGDAASLLSRMNGFAGEDVETAILKHASRDRGFYRAVFSDVQAWVNKQDERKQPEAATAFLQEHWAQLIQQSENLQDWQARMSVYGAVADVLQANGEVAEANGYALSQAESFGVGYDWRTTLRTVDDLQQSHPPIWRLMTALGRGAGKANSILLGNLMLELVSLRHSAQVNRFNVLAQWAEKLSLPELEGFLSEPEHLSMVRTDLGTQMPEAWWERHHQKYLLGSPVDGIAQTPAARYMRMMFEMAEQMTPISER